mmetsp:Transcript_37980/g.49182  ORF Transcript_37980/g.49182 Transcript_37980/m.49182 type:complete len:564 (-) Transcript_37980:62-1753(-)
MLEEFPTLLLHNQATYTPKLRNRLEQAYVFNISFENATCFGTPSVLENVDKEIGTRMRFLMSDLQWTILASRHPCSIVDVLNDLSQCTHKSLEDLTVILCVDGIQKLPHAPNSKESKFYQCLSNLCSHINSHPSFVIAIAAATTFSDAHVALSDSPQLRVYLNPPMLNPYKIPIFRDHSPSVAIKCIIADMGGHGRGLEILIEILERCGYPNLTQSLSVTYNELFCALKSRYPHIWDVSSYPQVLDTALIAALMGTNLNANQVSEFEEVLTKNGLCRIVKHSHGFRISIPYIWIKLLSSFSSNALLKRFLFQTEMNDANPKWQDWETFNLDILCLKSFVLAKLGNAVSVQTLHTGAKWGNDTITDVLNVVDIHPQTSLSQILTGTSYDFSSPVQCGQGVIIPSYCSEIVLNAPGAAAADSFCCRQISNGSIIPELHQYKLQQATLSQRAFISERNKAIPPDTPSIFLLITSSKSNVVNVPPNCGLVDRTCFEEYFGPFAGRAFMHDSIHANLASLQSLMSMKDIGMKRAIAIQNHRPFTDASDCHRRTGIPINIVQNFCFENW